MRLLRGIEPLDTDAGSSVVVHGLDMVVRMRCGVGYMLEWRGRRMDLCSAIRKEKSEKE